MASRTDKVDSSDERAMEAHCKESIRLAMRPARKAAGMTQEVLAERIDVSPVFCSRVEQGRQLPSLSVLVRIATELDIAVDELLGLDMARVRAGVPARDGGDSKVLRRLQRLLRRAPEDAVQHVETLLDWLGVPHVEDDPASSLKMETNVPCPRCGEAPNKSCRLCRGFGFVRGRA